MLWIYKVTYIYNICIVCACLFIQVFNLSVLSPDPGWNCLEK